MVHRDKVVIKDCWGRQPLSVTDILYFCKGGSVVDMSSAGIDSILLRKPLLRGTSRQASDCCIRLPLSLSMLVTCYVPPLKIIIIISGFNHTFNLMFCLHWCLSIECSRGYESRGGSLIGPCSAWNGRYHKLLPSKEKKLWRKHRNTRSFQFSNCRTTSKRD